MKQLFSSEGSRQHKSAIPEKRKLVIASTLSQRRLHQELEGEQSPAVLLSCRESAQLKQLDSVGQGIEEEEELCVERTPKAQAGISVTSWLWAACKGLDYPRLTRQQLLWGLEQRYWKSSSAGGGWNSDPARTMKPIKIPGVHLRAHIYVQTHTHTYIFYIHTI